MFPIASRRNQPTSSSALKKDRLTEMSVDGVALREISQPVVRALRPTETEVGGGGMETGAAA